MISHTGDFHLFVRMATATITDFKNFKILTVEKVKRVNIRYSTKFRGARSNRCTNMAISQDDGRRHLGVLNFRHVNSLKGHILRRLSIRCEDIAIFRFFNMAVSAILHF